MLLLNSAKKHRQPQRLDNLKSDRNWALVSYLPIVNQGSANAIGTLGGVATYGVGQGGNAFIIPSNNIGALSYGTNANLQLSISSGVIFFRRLSSEPITLFTTNYGAPSSGGFILKINPSGAVDLDKHDITAILTTSNFIAVGEMGCLAWSYNNVTGQTRLALNGILTTGTTSTTFTHGTVVRGGYYSASSTNTNAHEQYLFAISPTENLLDVQLISDSLNPWGIFSERPSKEFIFDKTIWLSGNIIESLGITNWRITAKKCATGVTEGSVLSGEGATSYSIYCITKEPYTVTLEAKIDYAWSAAKTTVSGDYVVAVNPDATPHLWKCTTAGTTHATTEPTWNLSGTTTDNTTTWTYVAPLVNPVTIGPKIPS